MFAANTAAMTIAMTLDAAGAFNALARSRQWATRMDAGLAFQAPELHDVLALWNQIAQPGRLPSRGQFTARLLKPSLRHLGIVGIEAPPGCARRFRNRYVGSAVTAIFGELTGLCPEDFLPPALLPRTIAAYEAVLAGGGPARVLTRFQHSKADYLAAEFFGGPLAEDGITPNMILTVTHVSRPSEGDADAWRLDPAA